MVPAWIDKEYIDIVLMVVSDADKSSKNSLKALATRSTDVVKIRVRPCGLHQLERK